MVLECMKINLSSDAGGSKPMITNYLTKYPMVHKSMRKILIKHELTKCFMVLKSKKIKLSSKREGWWWVILLSTMEYF